MLVKYIQILAISIASTVLIGVAVYRVLPSWQLLTGDVGTEGAWTVSILFHLIYGTCIGIGNITSFIVQKHGKVSIALFFVSSGITIVLLNSSLAIFQPVFASMLLFSLLLIIGGFIVCSVISIAVNVHNKSFKFARKQRGPDAAQKTRSAP